MRKSICCHLITIAALQVDVQLLSKLPHLVPLALLQYLSSSDCSHSLPYLTQDQLDAISKMQLLNRGRLSVQVGSDSSSHGSTNDTCLTSLFPVLSAG
jgi:hypothetical protein